MRPALVSIIIPSFNSSNYVRETVESALNQTHSNIEIVLVDDGSTDNTIDLFPEFESKGVKCYSIANSGASNARNYGLSQCTGEYIQFLDSDDVLVDTKIAKQLEMMQRLEADVCYSPWLDFNLHTGDCEFKFKFSHIDHSLSRTGKELMTSFGIENWYIPTLSWLVKKTIIKKAGLWDTTIINNNDGEYFSRILFLSEKVVCCNEPLVYYRLTPNSLGKLNSIAKIDSSFSSYQKIESLLTTSNDVNLMSYTKRMYYMQYKRIKKNYPRLAKRAAYNFDRIDAPSFLSEKKYYWKFIKLFGLYQGTKVYELMRPIWGQILKKGSQ